MRVLYLYPKSDPLISQHVSLLTNGLRQSAEIRIADSVSALKKAVQEKMPDIIHCHGLPTITAARAVFSALNRGARLVLTLHGQLEPWADERKNNIAAVYWQKEIVQKAYAVILLGRLERTNFASLKWNNRTEEIHNAVTTNTISPQNMSTATFAVYQKVLDSDTLALMNESTVYMLRAIIKVGIMGDRRWAAVLPSGSIGWRQLLLYAEHENIRNYVDYGISLLGSNVPAIDTTRIISYFPDSYTIPRPVHEIVGEYQGKETDYLLRIITHIRQQPLLLHLIELTRELYRDTVDDERLSEVLHEKGLTEYASSLMQVLSEQTGLDEGYMPLPPADNRLTQQIRQHLTNHLKI